MTWNDRFQGFLDFSSRAIFFVAYGAFLYASLHHIQYFFASFEPAGTSPVGPYLLAIAFDATTLILSMRISVGKKNLDTKAFWSICFFIFFLTVISWLMNYEYALQFQGQGLSRAGFFQEVNPVIASSFAILNIAYSIVARFFSGQKFDMTAYQERLAQRKAQLTAKHQYEEDIKDIIGTAPESALTRAARGVGKAIQVLNTQLHPVGMVIASPQPTYPQTPLPAWPEPQGDTREEAKEHFRDLQVWAQSQQEEQPLTPESNGVSLTTDESLVRDTLRQQEEEPITDPGIITQPKLHVMPPPFDPVKTVNTVEGKSCIRLICAIEQWGVSEGALKRFLGEYPQYGHSGWVGKKEYKLIETEAELLVKREANKSKRTARAAV